ncbi:MAG: tRNA pseudouridine(55) synthase TruB [Oscillospiraceae bacterium]|nr:tRNA pseudouridine(55) synthase TruB [Oscillospiraceae bacterium]
MNGVLGINKPPGFTSFDVVAKLRGILKVKKMGHAGTLDPMATGVLPILIGKATKIFDLIPDEYKEYLADFQFGIETDTLDITGQILKRTPAAVTINTINNVLPSFFGKVSQKVPAYSAVKIAGRKLYELARKGLVHQTPSREVTITKLEIKEYGYQKQAGVLLVGCSAGTYIRSLVADIGEVCGCGAVLTGLVRLQSCGIKLEQTLNLDDIDVLIKNDKLAEKLIGIDTFFTEFDALSLSQQDTQHFLHGAKIPIATIKDANLIKIYDADGSFLGLGRSTHGVLTVHKLLV